ncbi:type III secretion system inner membrane ring subunit SctD [Shewanella violacea]|uniref:Type III secretion system apparatus protein, YscD/HrpQ family n=1 Tax=Shewanella violacea (strain JCM 10179 / CIP 106290 / LMG 19151 / DSS12) TaxID=637905 RepID=D4ZKN1_SHEVD|nr:type III secretion system inner membrane ring subunit SctD [Shewanella violacea]BAJ02230.1 type III secretion system apparatus protein, YscD/HrpQ family [Shewanella violacea DSS12]
MSSKYKLLWLNGPLQGREFSLPLGSITIGPDGDIVAILSEVSELELFIDEEGVHLSKEVPTWVDGKPVEGLTLLPLDQVIELDDIAILVGKDDDVLAIRGVPKHMLVRGGPLFFLGFTSLISLLVLLFVLFSPVEESHLQIVLTPSQWLSRELNQSGLKSIKVSWSDSGVATLSGYCKEQQQMADLLSDLSNHGVVFMDHTLCGDQLLSNVKQILVQNGFSDAVVNLNGELGSVNISGAISAGEDWNKTVDDFNRLPGLISWNVSSQVNKQIKELITILRKDQLLTGIVVKRVDNTLVLTGKVSEEKQRQVMSVATKLNLSYPGGFKLVFQNIPVRDELIQFFNSQIVSFGGNTKFPFVELEDGSRLSVGSDLSIGYTISFMNINGMDLIRAGEIVHIPIII